MFKKKRLLSLVAVSSLALAACGTTDDSSDADDATLPVAEQEDTTSENPTDDVKNEENETMDPVEAFDIFLDKYPNAKVTQIELEKDMDSFQYKVEGFEENTEYELKIDPTDGAIIKESIDTDDDHDDGEITREQTEKITGLVDQALADVEEDATLKEWQLDVDDGIVKLEIELNKPGLEDIEYKFNVDTGELIEKD